MPEGSETAQEIKFWLELEGVLRNISDQLKSPEARTVFFLYYVKSYSTEFLPLSSILFFSSFLLECTLNTLKQAKRFHATAAFDTDTIGLKRAKEIGKLLIIQ